MDNVDRRTNRLYRGGAMAPAGTYVCLEDGHFARLEFRGPLPTGAMIHTFYLRVSASPRHRAPISFVAEGGMLEAA